MPTPFADDVQVVDKLLAYAVIDTSAGAPPPSTVTIPPPVPVDPTLDPTLHRANARGGLRFGPGVSVRLAPRGGSA